MDWNIIGTEDDMNEFMKQFNYFHDSCIKEIHYSSGTYVNNNLSMAMINNPVLVILFQRQENDLYAIEVEFSEPLAFHLKPADKNNTTEILSAVFMKMADIYYWADWDGWSITGEDRDSTTWVSAKSVKWRERADLVGGEIVYRHG
jgi:hypothetical protein